MKTNIKTVVKNWALVNIEDDLSPFFILWAIVEHDERGRYIKGQYVCSSRILYKDTHVRTHTGSVYELIGPGVEYTASYAQLILLGKGLSPTELNLERI